MKFKSVLLAAAMLSMVAVPAAQAADGPEVGANTGAMISLSKFRDTIDGNTGATVGFYGGYRWDLTEALKFSLIGQPQFTFSPGTERWNDGTAFGGGFGTMVIFTGGPKLTFVTGPVETHFTVQGGFYKDLTGVMSDTGGGA